jgi:hypothetical protein
MVRQTADNVPPNCFPAQPGVDRELYCGKCSQSGDSRKGTLGLIGSLTMPSDRNPSRYLAKTSPRYFTVPSSMRSVDPAIWGVTKIRGSVSSGFPSLTGSSFTTSYPARRGGRSSPPPAEQVHRPGSPERHVTNTFEWRRPRCRKTRPSKPSPLEPCHREAAPLFLHQL